MTDPYGELVTFLAGQFDEVKSRLTGVEIRLTGVEGRLTKVEGRLTSLEAEGARTRSELRAGFEVVNRRFDALERAS